MTATVGPVPLTSLRRRSDATSMAWQRWPTVGWGPLEALTVITVTDPATTASRTPEAARRLLRPRPRAAPRCRITGSRVVTSPLEHGEAYDGGAAEPARGPSLAS